MHSYNQTGVLINSGKNEVAKYLIKSLLQNNPSYCITKSDFQHLASILVTIFNKSDELPSTYYVPAQNGNSAKGKLFNAYCNYKATLGKTGVISRKKKTTKKTSVPASLSTLTSTSTTLSTSTSISESDIAMLQILKSKIKPWDEVKQDWTNTLNLRQISINNLKISKAEFNNQFLCLSQPKGYELVSLFWIIYQFRPLRLVYEHYDIYAECSSVTHNLVLAINRD